jgi:hypothetical protein
VAYALPALLIYALMLIYVLRFPTTAPVLAFVMPVYLGNFWCALLALREPEGTLIENSEHGLRFYAPATR